MDTDTGDAHQLVLFRHAKSGYPDGVADHDRPLAKRGRHDAPETGRWLARNGYLPDAVVCSTAQRARQTWDLASSGLASASIASAGLASAGPAEVAPRARFEARVHFEPRVYEATVLSLLMLVREFEEDQRTVMIVGHNPGLAELTAGLAEPPPAPPPSFPTAAVAVLGIPGTWADAAPAGARLLAFAAPSEMTG